MSHDALYDFAAQDPRRFSPQVLPLKSRTLPQSILGSVALAFVVTTCLWVVYANVAGPDGDAVETAASQSTDEPVVNTARKSARIAAGMSVIQKNYAALLNAGHSFGHPPGSFSKGALPTAKDQLEMPAQSVTASLKLQERIQDKIQNQVADKLQDKFPQVAAPTTAPRQLALAVPTVPLPSARPVIPEALQAAKPSAPKPVVEDKATVLAAISSGRSPSMFQKLFGKPKSEGVTLAYASPDGGIGSDGQSIMFDGAPKYDRYTAVYDISARTVYMPDGTELEAHSGLGKQMDDPRFVHVKMRGATPPHVYDLKMRESLFHGVEALRMTPVGGEGRIHGRTGLLTHTYMLGPRGDSNGCVSFKNYEAFLQAYKRGAVKRMVVVARLG
jgi:hypothetical protein